jgi:phosphopantetheinyl transferase
VATGSPRSDEVAVWAGSLRVPLGGVSQLETFLEPWEIERAHRFRLARDRTRYVTSHALLRQVLAECVGSKPRNLRFGFGPCGKPFLESERSVDFSMSRSGEAAVIAVARQRPVGIDLERRRLVAEWEGLEAFLSPAEAVRLAAPPGCCDPAEPEPAHDRFLTWWVRHEAHVKARGDGLGASLEGLQVEDVRGGHCYRTLAAMQSLASTPGPRSWADPGEHASYLVRDLPVGTSWVAAVAAEGLDWHPTLRGLLEVQPS